MSNDTCGLKQTLKEGFIKYLLLTEFRGPYRKLRTEVFPNRRGKKRRSVTYSTDREDEVSKIFIISLFRV